MKLWEGVASAFRLSLASFCDFVKTSIFFHHLNRNDDLKESGVGVTGILGVGVGILGKLGVGVGPYTFRLRNPGLFFWAWRLLLRVRLRPLPDDSLGALGLPVHLL